MRCVKCCECGKNYDYDEDGFCPKCGAFNLPPRETGGTVRREDGLNERNHEKSFLHREFHEEERERKKYKLDKKINDIQNVVKMRGIQPARQPKERGKNESFKALLPLLLFGIYILLNLLDVFF